MFVGHSPIAMGSPGQLITTLGHEDRAGLSVVAGGAGLRLRRRVRTTVSTPSAMLVPDLFAVRACTAHTGG
ncbi:hypothetical protein GCM10011579_024540 [Streptomyces albiflavescens]|uniref:Uncharacterized protein n=1 Tax=Streptomyces albiflavescens TaxID=1623582 RepID=A0A918D2M5_9ACTN|nr:hypothetical protein [Streptomyces albiflavescens]GGN59914.1 hypothetical protein GCM10011579_024540 [Streptomyces albiflavescens]